MEYFQFRQQKMKMILLAISISLKQMCTVRFLNYLFVRSLTRSLDMICISLVYLNSVMA